MSRFRFLLIPFALAGLVAIAAADEPFPSKADLAKADATVKAANDAYALTQAGGDPKKNDLSKTIKALEAQLKAAQDQLAGLDKKADAEKKVNPPKGDPPAKKFKTGAKRTPFPKIVAAMQAGKAGIHRPRGPPNSTPTLVARFPSKLSMLGNDQYGDCVTAESCAAVECYSVGLSLPEIVINDSDAINWAQAHGVLNGADLLSVIQGMEADGVKDSGGTIRKAGTPATVDYTNEATLQSAIALGPVSIAIGSGDLPSGAGSQNGWYALTSNGAPNDHCVGLWGFGKAEDLWLLLAKVFPDVGPMPTALAGKTLYVCYTWSTVGFVTFQWIQGTVQEAWVRNPTTIGLTPPTPPPTPQPITVAVGDVTGQTGSPVSFLPLVSGGTGPYAISYDYGDGAKDAMGSHTYSTAGTFTVTVVATDSLNATGSGTCKATIGTAPPIPPTPGAPTFTIKGLAPDVDGDYYFLKKSLGDRRLIDILNQQSPQGPRLTPAQLQDLQNIIDLFKGKRGK